MDTNLRKIGDIFLKHRSILVIFFIKNNIKRKGSVKDAAAEEMYKAYDDRKANIAQNIDAEDYEVAIKLIVECSEYINKFMENNRALSDDDDIRNKRVTFFTDFCGQCSRIIKIH